MRKIDWTIEELVKELANRGYETEVCEVTKNGVKLTGLTLMSNEGNVHPTVYINTYIDGDYYFEETVDSLTRAFDESVDGLCDFDVNSFFSREYVESHIYPAVQSKFEEENILKRDVPGFDDLEMYYMIDLDMNGSRGAVRVLLPHLSMIGMTEDEIYEASMKNLDKQVEVTDMTELLVSLMPKGCDYAEEMLEESKYAPKMLVVSNKERCKGSSVIASKKAYNMCAEILHTRDMVVIPSSIHEVIVISGEDTDLEYCNQMVHDVNATSIDPTEVLSDHAYKWSVVA